MFNSMFEVLDVFRGLEVHGVHGVLNLLEV